MHCCWIKTTNSKEKAVLIEYIGNVVLLKIIISSCEWRTVITDATIEIRESNHAF